jgi:hypothetical protein
MKKIMKMTPPSRPQMVKAMAVSAPRKSMMTIKAPKPKSPSFLSKAVGKVKGALAKREAASKGRYTRVGNQLYRK